ncbi:tetratricopeptide repeat-containing sensor histidine kinase [Xanthocytophaga flava]|nr:tetratricopeptide repeat-containing sensor histidine kinase [Xanthocytophaga flavus]
MIYKGYTLYKTYLSQDEKESGFVASLMRVLSLSLLHILLFSLSGHAQNKHLTDSLQAVLKTMPEDTNKVEVLRLLFNEYRYSDHEQARVIAQEELRLSLQLKYTLGEASAYRHLGISYAHKGKSVQAIEYYLKAIPLYERIHESFFVGACYNNIGSVYMDLKEWDKAQNNLFKAITIWKPLSDGPEGTCIALSNLGDIYLEQKQYKQALQMYEQSLEIAQQLKLTWLIAGTQTSIGNVYIRQQEYTKATSYLTKALVIAEQNHSNSILTQIYYYQSEISLASNQLQNALDQAFKALSFTKKTKSSRWQVKCYKQLAHIFTLQENYKQGVHFQDLYISLNDSLNNVQQALQIEKLQYNYQLEKKDLINQSLLKDKKLKEEEFDRNKTRRRFILGLLLIFIATTVFYRITYKRQKRMNQTMALQQQEIEAQNEEIRSQNDQISIQREDLTKANAALNKLFSIIAHDLRAPFRSIEGTITLFEEELLDPQEMQIVVQKLGTQVHKSSELLDKLLLWSKSQLEGFQVNPKTFDLAEVIFRSTEILEIQANQKKISITTEIESSLKGYADPDMIETIVRNLVSNAIKFCKENDTICIRAILKGSHISVSVHDTGQGIDEEVRKKILTPTSFYSTVGTSGEKGTGLGIHLCLEFLALNNGHLHIESIPGEGSIFTFTLPQERSKIHEASIC